MLPEIPRPVAVICHDAGAANHVLAWLADAPCEGRIHADGPARQLVNQHALGWPVVENLADALDGATALLSGTGWASDLEHRARREARARGLHTVAVIDHWVNYEQRFARNGETVLPDEVWVTDEHALSLARRCFPGQLVRQQPNTYLDTLLRQIEPMAHAGSDWLYVLEPARDTWGRDQPGEFQALDHFVSNLTQLGWNERRTIRLRPHPSDPPGKFDPWIERHVHLGVRLDDSTSLAQAVSRSSTVFGCESYALVVALAAGRRCVCTLPPWAPVLRLPHPGIECLRSRPGLL